jgi:hypothetical protein
VHDHIRLNGSFARMMGNYLRDSIEEILSYR